MSARTPITFEQLREAVDQYRLVNGGRFPTGHGHCAPLGVAWSTVDNALVRQSAGWKGRTSLNAWIERHMAPDGFQAEELADDDLELHEAMAPA